MTVSIESYIEQNFNNQKYDELYSFLATKYLKVYKLGKFDTLIEEVNNEFSRRGGVTSTKSFEEIYHMSRNFFQANMCVSTVFEKSYSEDFPFILRLKDIIRDNSGFSVKVVAFYPPNFNNSRNCIFEETRSHINFLERDGIRKVVLDEEDYAKVKKWFADCVGGVSNLESLVNASNSRRLNEVEYFYSRIRVTSSKAKNKWSLYNLSRLKDLSQDKQMACKFINDLAKLKNIPHNYGMLMENVVFGTQHSFGTEESRILGYAIIKSPSLHIVPISKSQQFHPIESVFSADEVAGYRNACSSLGIRPAIQIPVEGTLVSSEEEKDSFSFYLRKLINQGKERQTMTEDKKFSLPVGIPQPIKRTKRVERNSFPPEQVVKNSQPTSTQKPKEVEISKGLSNTLKGIFGFGKS